MFVSTLRKTTQPLLKTTIFLKPPSLFKQPCTLIYSPSRGFARDFKKSSTLKNTEPSSTQEEEKACQSTVTTQAKESIEGKTAPNQHIPKDKNFNTFMAKIYNITGLSYASCLGLSSALAASLPITSAMVPVLAIGGYLITLAGRVGMNEYPQIKVEERLPRGKIVQKSVNPWKRKIAFCSAVMGTAITVSPMIKKIMLVSPYFISSAIPTAVGLSVLTMAGAAIYTKYKPLNSFKAWEPPLYGTLFAVASLNIISLLMSAVIGSSPFSYALENSYAYLWLDLVMLFQMYDTHQVVKAYRKGMYDHLEAAMEFFLNTMVLQRISIWPPLYVILSLSTTFL